MTLNDLGRITAPFPSTPPMPLLFVGHGNPMNAIAENDFTRGWHQMGRSLPKPRAVVCISAHWETDGTAVTAMEKPATIHDFGGFPRELYETLYPAPGSPGLATELQRMVTRTTVELTHEWGLDHGCWSVLMHLFPEADIPVVQVSLDYRQPPRWHYDLAADLAPLRRKGVLLVGSGNMVHNLRRADWNHGGGFDWAIEANAMAKKLIADGNHQALIDYHALGPEMRLAVPTPEHYLPLLYILGMRERGEQVSFFNDRTELGSISMTSVKIDGA